LGLLDLTVICNSHIAITMSFSLSHHPDLAHRRPHCPCSHLAPPHLPDVAIVTVTLTPL
jgi:hypothetical protein